MAFRERIFHNIEKHENHYNGKRWPKKLQTAKQTKGYVQYKILVVFTIMTGAGGGGVPGQLLTIL